MSAGQPAFHAATPGPAAPGAIVAGHIALDVTPELYGPAALDPGRLTVVGSAAISTGGAVANVGVALHRLGVSVGLSAKIGDDLFGRAVLERLAAHCSRLTAGVVAVPGETTSYSVVISPPGIDRSFLHCPGANVGYAAADVPYAKLTGVRVFHFGYPPLMPVMYADGGRELRTMFERVRAEGPVTSLDLCEPDPDSEAGRVDWEAVLAHALPFVDVFAPSLRELLFILDSPAHRRLQAGERLGAVCDRRRLRALATTLIAMGPSVVAIKLGDQGLYVRTSEDAARVTRFCRRLGLDAGAWRDRELLAPCYAPRVVRATTGSGDATIAGLLAALLRGAAPSAAASVAVAAGASSTEAIDPVSGVPSWERLTERQAAGWSRMPVELELGDGPTARDPLGTLVLGA
jgi:sugar/nucleoside kinase (ribokinase family)